MSNLTIKSDNQFHSQLTSFKKVQASMAAQAHALACYAIVHALKHGNTERINSFFGALTKSQQPSFKRWIAKHCVQVSNDLSSSWLTMKKGEFVINTSIEFTERNLYNVTSDKEIIKLDNPEDIEELPSFLEIDSDKSKNPFDDNTIISRINSLIKQAEKSDSIDKSNIIVLKEAASKLKVRAA